jgi:hypothetical protein
MAKSGDVLSLPELGARIRFLETGAETGGARTVFEVTGPPVRLPRPAARPHGPDRSASSRSDGAMELVDRRTDPGAAGRRRPRGPRGNRARPAPIRPGRGDGPRHDHARRPHRGLPRAPLETALARRAPAPRRAGRARPPPPSSSATFGDAGARREAARSRPARGPRPAVLAGARAGAAVRARATAATGTSTCFVDEWDVAAPPHARLRRPRRRAHYPAWWTPVYIDVEAQGPPALGKESRQHFKGRLPLPPAHRARASRASSRRTSSRATSTATSAAAGPGR